ncbi:MAG: hypothetical protein A2W33_06445 [Chloroflexi bacterium RBG_16_52_11]|nr:MAG: hypothetical protein A2W33_06445 [Chloroflexi bacterium RBG_16_52_11]
MAAKGLNYKQQILLAALECSGGDCNKTFTMEQLLVCAWKMDKQAWGLRGFEIDHPDSDKIQKEIGTRGPGNEGVVDMGWLERADRRVYRLTPAGLAEGFNIQPQDSIPQEKLDRTLEISIKGIIEHPVFKAWLTDPARPKHFREAGYFWGIAPGTPSKTVRERVEFVERTLKAALKIIDKRGIESVSGKRGKVLFDKKDVERCLDFQGNLKQRFMKDLRLLDPEHEY